jgi:hypothetical protein
MRTIGETAPVSKTALWLGRVLSGFVVLFLLFDGAIKLVPWPIVTETMDRIGYGSSETFARSLGLITIVCTVLYTIPPTSIVGAILLTAVQPHAVRVLSRADGVGRALVARSEFACINTLSALTCLADNSQIRSQPSSKSLPSSPSSSRSPLRSS